ncbi:GIY-YIG nuclease family protein [Ascidiimonas sp. W6]|uniref:GIY-YIG nuclease family protein n=1 Tax=Ascidiimonas meishanensis TaxID=3128903 RepID=UPI0030EEC5CF
MYHAFVYIVTNKNKTVLYTGVTNNLSRRLEEHYKYSEHGSKSFTGRYNCYYLLYYEAFEGMEEAIKREKEIKKWRRDKKIRLIESINPQWEFLNNTIF